MPEKLAGRDWKDRMVRIGAIFILAWGLIILVVSFFFTPRSELDLGWLFVLAGVAFLSVDTLRTTLQNWNILKGLDIAPSVCLLDIGLGLVNKDLLFFSFYYGMALFLGALYLLKIFRPRQKMSLGSEKPLE